MGVNLESIKDIPKNALNLSGKVIVSSFACPSMNRKISGQRYGDGGDITSSALAGATFGALTLTTIGTAIALVFMDKELFNLNSYIKYEIPTVFLTNTVSGLYEYFNMVKERIQVKRGDKNLEEKEIIFFEPPYY